MMHWRPAASTLQRKNGMGKTNHFWWAPLRFGYAFASLRPSENYIEMKNILLLNSTKKEKPSVVIKYAHVKKRRSIFIISFHKYYPFNQWFKLNVRYSYLLTLKQIAKIISYHSKSLHNIIIIFLISFLSTFNPRIKHNDLLLINTNIIIEPAPTDIGKIWSEYSFSIQRV